MTVQVPTPRQILEIADRMGLSLTDADVKSFIGILRPSIAAYNNIDAMPDNLPEVKYARTPGRRPLPEENKFNAWYVKTTVQGASRGQVKRSHGGAQRQHHARRRADDERRGDA